MTILFALASFPVFCFAARFYFRALYAMKEQVPEPFRSNEVLLRTAMDTLVWNPWVPIEIRRDYALSQIWGAIFAGFLAVAMTSLGGMQSLIGFLFALPAIAWGILATRKYKKLQEYG